VTFVWQGLQEAWQLIVGHDPYLWNLLNVTLKVCLISTLSAAVIGLPLGLLLGLARFRGRGLALIAANAGLGLPPVIVGVILFVVALPRGPLGELHLVFTLKGVYVAQTILALPVIVALTSAAVRDIADGLIAQARAYGARRHRIALLALREARVGVMAALIAAVGAGLSEVGAVAIIGGNLPFATQTLASAALEEVNAGRYASAIAIGMLLLGLILVISAVLTVLQYAGSRNRVPRQT
jgi:tungstate transport system permease protein